MILVVEDDEGISGPLARALQSQGYTTRVAGNGAQALVAADADPAPDLVLLDLGLPDLDGVELARRLRERIPLTVIVMLTARDTEVDIVVGLDAGADDYVTKPFRLAELLARVRAHLRRGNVDERATPLVAAGIVCDPGSRRCHVGDAEVPLRPREFDLLAALMARAGDAVSRDELMSTVWDAHWYGSTKTLDMHVSSLRRKLAAAGASDGCITTMRGYGYRFERDPVSPKETAR